MTYSTGQVLKDRYRIVKLLGQGGFGAVYRAWDINLKVVCALKVNTEISQAAAGQFEREANILAQLQHPNMPRVTDYFILPGMGQYLVMDYVEGEDLHEKIEKSGGALPESQVLGWMMQIFDAIIYLHNQKPPVIHRDINPANIRITSEGRAMLVDFGIAKIYDPQLATTLAAKAVTPGFSPPEQYGGAGTDTRSDIYALGATLYNLLTGKTPPESVMRMGGIDSLRPPRDLNPRVRPRTQDSLLKAMELNARDRFQKVQDFQAALTVPGASPGVESTKKISMPVGATMVAPIRPAEMQPAVGSPTLHGPEIQRRVEKRGMANFMPWIITIMVGGGLIFAILIGFLWFSGEQPDEAATQTAHSALLMTRRASAKTATQKARPPASYTPFPTHTTIPTSAPIIITVIPTAPPTVPPQPTPTRPPSNPPTATPVSSSAMVRIWNKTSGDVSLYRIGLSGETHYLSWLSPGFYGEYKFPSLRTWTIEYCRRDSQGNVSNCKRKSISLTKSGQEFSVP